MKEYWEYILLIVIPISIAFILSYVLRKFFTIIINKKSKQIKTDPTNFIFIKNSIRFILYSIAIVWIFINIPSLNSIGKLIFASSTVLAAILGFAAQKPITNIIGGLFILAFRPFKVSDIIQVSDIIGIVEEITLRHIVIKDFEHNRVIIPNGVISEETIVNTSIVDNKIRRHVEIDISYGSDISKAMNIMEKIIVKHPLSLDQRTKKEKEQNKSPIEMKVIDLGDFSVKIRAYVWANGFIKAFNLHCDLLWQIKEAFDKNGIEIPFPYRTIVMKNPPPSSEPKN